MSCTALTKSGISSNTSNSTWPRQMGICGVRRGKKIRTTMASNKTDDPLDSVKRQFKATRFNELWVSDFTYVSTWQGWLFVAFVIDVFARRIVGWSVSSTMTTDFVLDAQELAIHDRKPQMNGPIVHHSDRGTQYLSIRYTQRLAQANIDASVGTTGDS